MRIIIMCASLYASKKSWRDIRVWCKKQMQGHEADARVTQKENMERALAYMNRRRLDNHAGNAPVSSVGR